MHEPEEEIELPSLATHEWQDGQQITRWHRLVAWNLDQTRDLYAVRLARKGDQVRVTGTVEEVELPGDNGEVIRFTQIVIQDFEYLKKKARQWD
jgi:single-stranded DNA-binding protein